MRKILGVFCLFAVLMIGAVSDVSAHTHHRKVHYAQCTLPNIGPAGTAQRQIWFPGQYAPYTLYIDTTTRTEQNVAPSGWVIIYSITGVASAGQSANAEFVPLSQFCP